MATHKILVKAGVVLTEGDKVTDTVLKREYVSITDATSLLGMAHAQYVRRLVVGGKLGSIKVQLEYYQKWFVSRVSIASYLRINRRTNTDRRYILRTEKKNEAAIRKALDAVGVKYSLELNYKGSKKK